MSPRARDMGTRHSVVELTFREMYHLPTMEKTFLTG